MFLFLRQAGSEEVRDAILVTDGDSDIGQVYSTEQAGFLVFEHNVIIFPFGW